MHKYKFHFINFPNMTAPLHPVTFLLLYDIDDWVQGYILLQFVYE